MEEGFKALPEALKTLMYELLAILLPGVLLVYLGTTLLGLPTPPAGTIGALIASYLMGLVVQGVANWLVNIRPIKFVLGERNPPLWQAAEDSAAKFLRSELREDVPLSSIVDICLTYVDSRRHVYDKFMYLQDTARGLALVWTIALMVTVCVQWHSFRHSIRPTLFVIGLMVAILASIERYRRYFPLAKQALYGQVFAKRLEVQAAERLASIQRSSPPPLGATGTAKEQ